MFQRTLAVCLAIWSVGVWDVSSVSAHHVSDYLDADTTVVGRVVAVSDGDSFLVEADIEGKVRRVPCRLALVDAPEKGQPMWEEARDALSRKIEGKRVRVDIYHLGTEDIAVVIVRLQERNINLEMVREGLAEAYREYLRPPYQDAFLAAQKEAKDNGGGVWSLADYERPSEYRLRLGIKNPVSDH